MPSTYYQNHPRNGDQGQQTTQQPDYRNRYKRDASTAMDQIYSAGPYIIAFVSFLIAVAALVSLLAVDVITGRFSTGYLTNPDYGWYFSFATTGVALAAVGTAMYGWRERWDARLVVIVAILALVPIGIDVYFDGIAVDVIKYGRFISLSEIAEFDRNPFMLFRIMVAILSAIGEPLAAASVIIFPVMKELFKGVMS